MIAASTLFAQGGIDDVSVAELLEMSDLKAPSLYHHYQDKEGLYVSWALLTIDGIRARVSAVLNQNLTVHETLVGIVNGILAGATVDLLQVTRDLRSLKSQTKRDEIRDAIETAILEPLRQVISRGQAEGLMQQIDPVEAAQFFLHCVMYSHPNYASVRLGTRVNGKMANWIVSWFMTASKSRINASS
ncbi:MAG: TetR/AcrR family transcriptional regulator [Fimbriimonadaceae bacterium]|jgi:AcrR family transcriptional regulator|nr:TetR/AcrR family transcriptional regulator [Fimbriimonadaceae bacterium]